MGAFVISILGIGGPDLPKSLAAELVGKLKAAGYTLEAATYTHGAREDLVATAPTPKPVDPLPPQPPTPSPAGRYTREVEGTAPEGRFFYGFDPGGNPPIRFDFSIPTDGRKWTLAGDGGWVNGDVTMKFDGQVIDPQQPLFGAGAHYIEVIYNATEKNAQFGVGHSVINFDRRG